MIYNKISRKISSLKKETEIFEIVFLYRYVSLIITSFLYLTGNQSHSFVQKTIIVGCISISSMLLHYLYIKNEASALNTKILILIETIGNTFILIPSGGLNSPYVWYSLNTILMTSVRLSSKYCWINLFIYLFNSTIITEYIVEGGRNFTSALIGESNLLLSLVLITALIQIPVKYAKRIQEKSINLEETNKELMMANKRNKEAINYIMELYQGVHLFTAPQNKEELIEQIIDYSKKIIKTETVVFVESIKEKHKVMIESHQDSLKEEILSIVHKEWDSIIKSPTPTGIKIRGKDFILTPIVCNYRVYGVLAMDITSQWQVNSYRDIVEQLRFLTSLSTITFEKFELQKMNEELLINEEQNRIANEIHDGILQRLFSVSCSIFTSIKHLEKNSVREITKDLNQIRMSINNVMKDLRDTIYSLSWRKDGTNNFIKNIESYVEEIRTLNNIDIHFYLEGNDEILVMNQKRAIYRIICEGIGNAVRHGKASHIEVLLTIEFNRILLEIIDNGIGFDPIALEKEGKMGLGIKNIQLLTHSLDGSIDLESKIGSGTKMIISIPSVIEKIYKEEVI